MEKEYRAKLDASCVLNTLFFAIIFVVYFLFASRKELWVFIACCVVLGLIVLFFTSIILLTKYKFTENYLLISYGLFSKRIYYKDIEAVKAVKNLYPSFCLSIDRVEIKMRKAKLFLLPTHISPKNKEEFIDELNSCVSKVDRSLYE